MNNQIGFKLSRLDFFPSAKHYFMSRIFADWYINNLSIEDMSLKYGYSTRQIERFIFKLPDYISFK